MISHRKLAKVTFHYRIDKEPTTLLMLQTELKKDMQRLISLAGVYKYGNTKVDLTIVNQIQIEFFSDDVVI